MNLNSKLFYIFLFIFGILFASIGQDIQSDESKTESLNEKKDFVDTFEDNIPLSISFFNEIYLINNDSFNAIAQDTFPYLWHQFDEGNSFSSNYNLLGNYFSTLYKLELVSKFDKGIRLGLNAYNSRFTKNNDYRHTNKPYTISTYHQGFQQIQNIDLQFTTQVKPNLNFNFRLNRGGSAGLLDSNFNAKNLIQFNGWYKSLSNRYLLLYDIDFQRLKSQESGGLVSDTPFSYTNDFTLAEKYAIATNVSQTSRIDNNRFNSGIKQYYFLGRKTYISKSDSTAKDTLLGFSRNLFIKNSLEYRSNRFNYRDRNPSFELYKSIPKDTLLTYDTIIHHQYRSQLAIGLTNKLVSFINYGEIGLEFENNHFNFNYQRYTVDKNVLSGYYHFEFLLKKNKIDLNGYQSVYGYTSGDYQHHISYLIKDSSNRKLNYKVIAEFKNISPAFTENYTLNNQFFWWRTLEKTQVNSINGIVNYRLDKILLSVDLKQIQIRNNIIANQQSVIVQDSQLVNYTNFGTTFQYTNSKFGFIGRINVQEVDNKSIRVPNIISKTHIFYVAKAFKNNMLFRPFIDVSWFSSFKGNSFNPLIGEFYLQDSLEVRTEPIVDFGVALKVKNVNGYLSIRNVFQGLPSYNSFTAPNYPITARNFVFGIRWQFSS